MFSPSISTFTAPLTSWGCQWAQLLEYFSILELLQVIREGGLGFPPVPLLQHFNAILVLLLYHSPNTTAVFFNFASIIFKIISFLSTLFDFPLTVI